MRDFCSYIITPVEGYRSERTDAALQQICFDIHNTDNYNILCETCYYDEGGNGDLEINGYEWHDDINDMLIKAFEDQNVSDVPFMVTCVDYDVGAYEDAPTCSFILNGHAWFEDVIVTTVWPEWSEDLRWKAE